MPDGHVNSSDSNNLPPSLDDTRKKLITKLGIVKKGLNSKLGSTRILPYYRIIHVDLDANILFAM
jgi:hypothetical protein